MEDELMTPLDLANRLKMSMKWVVKHTQARRIPGQVKVGGNWRYRRLDVEKRLLAGQFLLPNPATFRGKGD
jgi:hypothetical protein